MTYDKPLKTLDKQLIYKTNLGTKKPPTYVSGLIPSN